jgi:sec-independent protein translocase protein TatA
MSPLLAMFGIGTTEMIVVMVVILVLFGHRLPSVMRSMGRGIKEFKEGINDETPEGDDEHLEDAKPKSKKSTEDAVNS